MGWKIIIYIICIGLFLTIYFECLKLQGKLPKKKKNVQRGPLAHYLTYLNSNTLHFYSTVSKPGNWLAQSTNLIQISTCTHFTVHVCVCVPVYAWAYAYSPKQFCHMCSFVYPTPQSRYRIVPSDKSPSSYSFMATPTLQPHS